MKVFIILAVAMAVAIVSTNAMVMTASQPTGLGLGGAPLEFLQNVILQKEANKILATPDLDADLRTQTEGVLQNAQENFANCKAIAFVGLQYRCFFMQLKTSQNELKAINDEVKRRADAAAATEAATDNAEAASA